MGKEFPDEWTQEEYLIAKEKLAKDGVEIFLIDTILSKIPNETTIVYNPYELSKKPQGSVFLFYCDSGKSTLSRLTEYKKKFPYHHCISLYGGRSYWRKNLKVN
jgi:hypothetical protein